MSLLYRDVGIVLRTYRLGETDRIVVLMTENHGKVRAVARGARKATSKLGGRVEPMSHVSLLLREGRQLHQISQAETLDHFRTIRGDLDRLAAGDALLEASDLVSQEHEPDDRLYRMLLGALRTLDAGLTPMLVPSFHLKLLANDGVGPELDVCVSCGSDGPFVAFDPDAGGVLCRLCRRGVAVSMEAIELAQRVLGGELRAALAEPASAATHEVQLMATRAFEHHVERRLRAAHVLD
jgi:DNA repair protein RecO (recombination protein O)